MALGMLKGSKMHLSLHYCKRDVGVDKALQHREGALSYQLLTGQIALRPRRSKSGLSYC